MKSGVFCLLIFVAMPFAVYGVECPVPPAKGGPCWTTEDVLSSNIDHHAQSAMFRMFARGGLAAFEASAILCAVKDEQLEGVFLPDQGVPALRARAAGSNWWEMIPQGASSTCYKAQPASGPPREPLIVFRKQIQNDKDLVAAALRSAWHECGIPETEPRCYVATISKPLLECESDEDCVRKGLGNVCFGGYCGKITPGDDDPPKIVCESKPGECDPNIPQTVWRSCPSGECVRVAGQRCGVCREPGDRFEQCLNEKRAEYDRAVAKCRADELPGAANCVAVIAKCMIKPDPTGCLKALGCGAGSPHFKRVQCELEANKKLHEEQKKCMSG